MSISSIGAQPRGYVNFKNMPSRNVPPPARHSLMKLYYTPKNKSISNDQIRSIRNLPMWQQVNLMVQHKVGLTQYAKAMGWSVSAIVDRMVREGAVVDDRMLEIAPNF